jgi:hypothetical protein
MSGGNGGQVIQGCLTGSAGSYTLTDSAGRSYTLSGDGDQLSSFSGQEVQITGTVGANSEGSSDTSPSNNRETNSDTSSNTTATNSSGTPSGTGTIQVESVTKVFDHCGSGSENPPGNSETPPKRAGVSLLGVLGFGFMLAGLAAGRNRRASN